MNVDFEINEYAELESEETEETTETTDTMSAVRRKNMVIKPKPVVECMICCDEVSKKEMVSCVNPKCEFAGCTDCYKKYLLDHPSNPNCMDCSVGFDHSSLVQYFGSSFVMKDLRSQLKQFLLERELAKMPETQTSVDFQRKVAQKKVLKAKKELKEMRDTRGVARTADVYVEKKQEVALLENELYGLNIRRQFPDAAGESIDDPIVMKCEVHDCNGFVVSSTHKCGICDSEYCKKCLNQKKSNHRCKEDDVKTAKAIVEHSRPCPSCGTFISKVSGCNQMWCTQCKTSFCWRTGKVEKGVIHNPHYFEWLRDNPDANNTQQENPEVQGGCVRIPHLDTLTTAFVTGGLIGMFRNSSKSVISDRFKLVSPQSGTVNMFTVTYSIEPLENIRSVVNVFVEKEQYYRDANLEVNSKFVSLMASVHQLAKELERVDLVVAEARSEIDADTRCAFEAASVISNEVYAIAYQYSNKVYNKIVECMAIPFKEMFYNIHQKRCFSEFFETIKPHYDIVHSVQFECIQRLRASAERSENEKFMFDKRVEFLLGNLTAVQLERSASMRHYRIQRLQKQCQLYELVMTVGTEEFHHLMNTAGDVFKKYFPLRDGVSIQTEFMNKLNLFDCAFLKESTQQQIDAEKHLITLLNEYFDSLVDAVAKSKIKLENLLEYFNEQYEKFSSEYKCKNVQLTVKV